MKTVMCFGTFDLLHLGHLHYFKQAKKQGDYLIVVIARDSTKKKQNKKPLFSEKERLELIKSLRLVDETALGHPKDHFKIIIQHKPDVICLGYDHAIKEDELRKKLAAHKLYPKIRRAKPFRLHQQKGGILKWKILRL